MLDYSRGGEHSLELRVPEPELMEGETQIVAYAETDFSAENEAFIRQFEARFGASPSGRMIDLGCGPGRLTFEWAQRYPELRIDAVDGSLGMIGYAQSAYRSAANLEWRCARIPLPSTYRDSMGQYDVVVSNSLLHHLPAPSVLWTEVERVSRSGSFILIGDLCRPPSIADAQGIVATYAGTASPILKADFLRSLCAAYRVREVQSQLLEHGLSWLSAEQVSDRHLVVWGVRP